MIMNVNNVITNLKYFREFQSLRLRFVLSAVALYEEKSARVLGLFTDYKRKETSQSRGPSQKKGESKSSPLGKGDSSKSSSGTEK